MTPAELRRAAALLDTYIVNPERHEAADLARKLRDEADRTERCEGNARYIMDGRWHPVPDPIPQDGDR